jgi:hypothetical protein
LSKQGNDGQRVGRAAVQQQGDDLLVLDQDARVFHRALGVEAVVHADHLDPLAIDAALRVDLVDDQLRAQDRLLHAGRDQTGEVGRLADHDLGRRPLGGCRQHERGGAGLECLLHRESFHKLIIIVKRCVVCF